MERQSGSRERHRWSRGASGWPMAWGLVLACAHSGPLREARSEWHVVHNGFQLSLSVTRESEESLRLRLTGTEACRDVELAGRVYAEGPRYVTKGWAGERRPCAGAGERPVAGALVEGMVIFERSRRTLPMQALTDEGGLATFDMRGARGMAAYCGEGELRFEAGGTKARRGEDTPGLPYDGDWPATLRLPLARPRPTPIAEIASPQAAEIARACCAADVTSASAEPCSDLCAGRLHAGDCLDARRACRVRDASPVALSCDDGFAICLGARATNLARWDRCVSECTGQKVVGVCSRD